MGKENHWHTMKGRGMCPFPTVCILLPFLWHSYWSAVIVPAHILFSNLYEREIFFAPKNLNAHAKCKKIKLNLQSGRWQRNIRQTFTWSDTTLCEKCRRNRYPCYFQICVVFTIHDISQTISALVLYLFIPSHGSTHFYKIHTLIASTNLAACQA